jgi:signal transduction histidine kinase
MEELRNWQHRLVRVGVVLFGRGDQVRFADAAAVGLLVGPAGESLEGTSLSRWLIPEMSRHAPDETAWVGAAPSTGLQLAVHPFEGEGLRGASIVALNAWLAEAQALASVQLRRTVQSVIAGFAHEVRNPMASILSLTEAAMLSAPHDTPLVRIPGLVARVEALLKHALSYSKPQPPQRGYHQVGFVVDRVLGLLRPRADRVVRPRVIWVEDATTPVYVDLLHAEQILLNLVENALDVAATAVELRVTTNGLPSPHVCVAVEDDGPGIAADTMHRIFEPFFTTKANGTGLGLAIARDLSRLNGGDLSASRSALGGACFLARWPSSPRALSDVW